MFILQQLLPTDAVFLEVPALEPVHAELLLSKCLQSKQRTLSEELRDKLLGACKHNLHPFSLHLAGQFLHQFWDVPLEGWLPCCANLKDQIGFVLDELDSRYGAEIVGRICCYLYCARHGLSDVEVMDLLSCDETALDAVYKFWEPEVRRIPNLLWEGVKAGLLPFLVPRTSNGLQLYSIGNQCFQDAVMSRYKAVEGSVRLGLLDYFEGKWTGFKPYTNIEGKEVKKPRFTKPQSLAPTADCYNRRVLDELPFHMFKVQRDYGMLVSRCLFDWPWLLAKLTASSLALCLHEVKLALSLSPQSDSVVVLRDFLLEHAGIIIQDPAQFPTYLYTEVEVERRNIWRERIEYMSTLYDAMKKCIVPQLVAVNHDARAMQSNGQLRPILMAFFRISEDPCHLISVAPDTGKLQVWNIVTQEAVRTLTGLNEPRNVKLCDSTTAVVLCNRELKIYNLDEGTLLCELKGVLNIRMPYYGIHSKDYTIALARNRMYLNLMDNSTGDMEATFKVGEDRFLNSLLVSENGEVCVCGDGVQKPFPLLVWDLPKRKLVHDLRIQGHEFVTSIAAISKDGHYVASVCKVCGLAVSIFLRCKLSPKSLFWLIASKRPVD